jgi:hypothetical protein
MVAFYILASLGPAAAQAASEDPDALYADRANLRSAVRCSQILAEVLSADPRNYTAAWKLARINYWLATHVPKDERAKVIHQGIDAGRRAARLAPDRPEGHFWVAAMMSRLAESSTMAGVRYRVPIKESLERVLKIEPAYLQGSADRALGRWYFLVPSLFGGSKRHAEAHLRKSLTYDPDSTLTHLFLAELLIDTGRPAEARYSLNRVINAPRNPDWIPEDEEFKAKARQMLQRLR